MVGDVPIFPSVLRIASEIELDIAKGVSDFTIGG